LGLLYAVDRAWARPDLGGIYLAGVAAVAVLLAYQHWLVRPDDLSRVNRAFFQVNAVISLGLLAGVVCDLYWKGPFVGHDPGGGLRFRFRPCGGGGPPRLARAPGLARG